MLRKVKKFAPRIATLSGFCQKFLGQNPGDCGRVARRLGLGRPREVAAELRAFMRLLAAKPAPWPFRGQSYVLWIRDRGTISINRICNMDRILRKRKE